MINYEHELTFKERKDDEEEIEKELKKIRGEIDFFKFFNEFNWAHKTLGTDPSANRQDEIKKAYLRLRLKWDPDKWKQREMAQECKRKGFECGAESTDRTLLFHSKECKEDYKSYLINLFRIEKAFNFLTGKSRDRKHDEPADSLVKCDYCGKEYNFKNQNYGRKEFRKKNNETEPFDFCSADCYNNFFFCRICEKPWKKDNTNGQFCSDENHKKSSNGNNSEKLCCKCSKPVGNSNIIYNDLPVCISCVTKKCRHCDKQGIPLEGSGWMGYREDIWFCCEEHVKNWRKDNQNQQWEEQEEEDFPVRENGSGSSQNEREDNSQDTSNFSLIQSQAQTEQKIEKLLKENDISDQELNKEKLLGGTDWKDYLKKLGTPQKVAEFFEKMKQTIAALKAKKMTENSSNKDKNPKNDGILPVVILFVSFFVLTSLLLIIRKRRRRRF